MPAPGLSAAVARLGRAVAPDPPSDGRLVGAFVAARDGAAFAELVARHGPMVFAVCLRLTGHRQDAEDAFQAAFVVLARRAADVRPREAVGNWLYGVAVRVAREARAMAARRRSREVPLACGGREPSDRHAGPGAHAPTPAESEELGAVLHEELAALPDKYRTLLVLCDLEGQPQTAVAGRLGLPVGTVYSRLAAARAGLAARLRKRGLAPAAAVLAGLLAEAGRAAVPPGLLARAAGVGASPDAVPAAVAALSDGAIRTMLFHKFKLILAGGLLVAAAAGLAAAGPRPDNPARLTDEPAGPAAKAAPAPVAAKGPNKILYHKAGHPTLVDPDGKNEKRVAEELGPGTRGEARLSPDGKWVAVIARLAKPGDPAPDDDKPVQKPGGRLYVVAADGLAQVRDLGVDECRTLVWSPDGGAVVTTEFRVPRDEPKPGQRERRADVTQTRVDVTTGRREEFNLLGGQLVTDWSRDGKHFVTTVMGVEDGREVVAVRLVDVDGDGKKELTDEGELGLLGRLSPDGKRLLYVRANRNARGRDLVVRGVAGGKPAVVEVPDGGAVVGYCWSPDGKRIAYTRHGFQMAGPGTVEWTLTVCDPDGRNAKVIATHAAAPQPLDTGGWVDWR